MSTFFENFDPIAGVARPLNENTPPPAGGGAPPSGGGSNYRYYQGIDNGKWKDAYVLYTDPDLVTSYNNEYGQNTPTDFGTPTLQREPETVASNPLSGIHNLGRDIDDGIDNYLDQLQWWYYYNYGDGKELIRQQQQQRK